MLDDILKQIDYMLVLRDLNPRPRGSKEIWVNCPKCGRNEAFIYRDGRAIMCRRGNNCGETTELLELVSGIKRARGEDFFKACEMLAKAGGAQFERKRMTPEQRVRLQAAETRADALTLLRDLGSAALKRQWDDFTGGEAVGYLEKRGFDVIKCLEYGFGVIENVEELASSMTLEQLEEVGFYAKHEDNTGYFTQKWDYRILIPLRDYKGKLLGFAGRTYRDHKQKYMNTRGTSLKDLVAVELCPALEHGGTVIGVEGFLDPFKARQHGIPNVVAVGTTGKALSPERWELLHSYGVKQFIFITDNDKAGAKGLEAALQHVDQAKQSPDVFTMSLPAGKDLDEWIEITANAGKLVSSEFGQLYRQRLHSDRLRAQTYAIGLDCSTEGDRWTYLNRCMEYDATVKNPKRLLSLVNHFWPEVQRVADVDTATIREVCDKVRADRQREEKKRAVEAALSQSKVSLNSTSPELVTQELKAQLLQIESTHKMVTQASVASPELLLSSDLSYLEEIADKEYLGIAQRTLPTLDALLSGLRGLTVLGGETNIGKTILLCQMALGAVLNNPDVCCLFASLEMPPQTLRFRMLSHLTGLGLQRLAKAYKVGDAAVLRALDFMETKVLPKIRFLHPQEPDGTVFTVDTLCHEAEQLKLATGATRCVIIIDFLGIWPVDDVKYKTDTMREKKQIGDALEVRNRTGAAVVTVMEVRKRPPGETETERDADDFMGTSRSIYLADNLIAVYRFSDKMLHEHYNSHMGYTRARASPIKAPKGWMKDEAIQEEIEGIRRELDFHAVFPLQLKIVKVRDGGKKGKINLMMHWDGNAAEEGINFERFGQVFTENTDYRPYGV